MGRAIAEQLKSEYHVYVFDKDNTKTAGLTGIEIAQNISDLLVGADTLVLAVKPQDFKSLLEEIRDHVRDKLIITIAAGISTAGIERILGEVRVVRVMPNMPAKIRKGMSCLSKGMFASDQDLEFAESLFREVGETLVIKENMMGFATATSGSGPGLLCDLIQGKSMEEARNFTERDFIPKLAAAANALGFSAGEAKLLAETTARGTIEYLESKHLSAEEVKKQVASPEGTTEAGLKKLGRNIKNLDAALKAAAVRAQELSKGL